MSFLSCIVCGALTDQSYCIKHRSAAARGYGYEHRITRRAAIKSQPFCSICGHRVDPDTGHCEIQNCIKCPLQLHHKYGKRYAIFEVLCAVHNRKIGKPGYVSRM